MVEEEVKNRIILIVGILCLILFFWAIGTSSELSKQKKNLQNEIRKRLGFEEQNTIFLEERPVLEEQIKQLNSQLEQEKEEHAKTKKAFSGEQLANESIKEELEKVTRLKEALEDDLKEALIKKPGKKKR